MPIRLPFPIAALEQKEFGEIAYDVMEAAFQIHHDLGRFFDESVYQAAIAAKFAAASVEVPISVLHEDFVKHYAIDLVINQNAIFELKTADTLHPQHRAQLLNYLMLTECKHGKLINLRSERVEHEFVNCILTRSQRADFEVHALHWEEECPSRPLQPWFEAAIRDWGTGLDRELYADCAAHFFGGVDAVTGRTDVFLSSRSVATQPIRLAYPGIALEVTTLQPSILPDYLHHLHRFLLHTSLTAIKWINVHRQQVSFQSIKKESM
jgi:GxxExxY protein